MSARVLKMAKKKTSGSPTPATGSETLASAPRQRRTTAKSTTAAVKSPEVANDRAQTLPEPAGQRVTSDEASTADSVTFVSVTATAPTYEEIAEAAYHRYLSRGCSDGLDFEDWIEAEKALKTR
jgi:hypothetical protein